MSQNNLLNNKKISKLLHNDPIVVLDGGARGELFSPFNQLSSTILKVMKFEPDPGAKIIHTENEIVVPKALYNKTGEITLNVAYEPTTSSVFPFNRELQKYIDPHQDVRRSKESITVECTSLDEFCKENSIPNVDFIKLDIHGCESEVLEGAKSMLSETTGLLVENWILPIHKGQKTRAAVELFLTNKGFYVFEEYVQSAWRRLGKKYHKRQPVTIDTLYFKDPLIDHNVKNKTQAIKLIGVAELFKHYGYAYQLAEYFYDNKIITNDIYSEIINHFDKYNNPTFIEKMKDKLFSYLGELLTQPSFK